MPRPAPIFRRLRPRSGFTLIELLTVISIIGLLAGILVPTISVVVKKNRISRTITLYNTMALAFESYKEHYGRYPIFKELSAEVKPWKTNPNEIDYSFGLNDGNSLIRQVLMSDSAYQTTASAPGATNYNRDKISFLTLDDSMQSNNPPGTSTDAAVVDGFGNSDIGAVVHVGTNSEIDKDAFTKGVSDAEGNGPLVPKVVRNIPLNMVFYSLLQDLNNDDINSVWITSWTYGDYNQ
jgi:prepilin-type N-terminal cleavage/methylation domain-containing protein